MLAAYGVVAAYAFGCLLNLSSWPFVLGIAVPGHTGLAFVPGRPDRGEPAPLPGLHADHVHRLVRHRPRDHERRRDRGARPGSAHDPATSRPPCRRHRDDRKGVAATTACPLASTISTSTGRRPRCPSRPPASRTRPVPRSEEPLPDSSSLHVFHPSSAEEAQRLLATSRLPVDSLTQRRIRSATNLSDYLTSGRRRPEWVWAIRRDDDPTPSGRRRSLRGATVSSCSTSSASPPIPKRPAGSWPVPRRTRSPPTPRWR